MRICVVALGKIGLPLAVQCAMKGHDVIGADVNADVVVDVTAGRVPFPGEANLRSTWPRSSGTAGCERPRTRPRLSRRRGRRRGRAAGRRRRGVSRLPRDGRRDVGDQAGTPPRHARQLRDHAPGRHHARSVSAGARGRLGPPSRARPLRVPQPGARFSGRIFADLRKYPKLSVGSTTSSKRAVEFYEAALDFDERPDLARANGVWDLGSAEAAELAKLAETTYRDVNIAFANEFAMFADSVGVDVFGVIDASNSQPFSHIHRPGIAVGGHCIPVYPRFYLSGDPSASLVAVARDVNETMPGYAVSVLSRCSSRSRSSQGRRSPCSVRRTAVASRRPRSPASSPRSSARRGRCGRRCPRPAVHRRRAAITGVRAVPSRRAMRCGGRPDRPRDLPDDRTDRPAGNEGHRRRSSCAVGGRVRGGGRSSAGTRWSRRLSSPATRPTSSIGFRRAGSFCPSRGSNAGMPCFSSRP